MVKKEDSYIPERADIVWLQFNPQAGHEQAGRRPALVVSPQKYNDKVGLALICPITSRIKGYPFEVVLPSNWEISGAVLADQVKSLDWRIRHAEYICKSSANLMEEVLEKIEVLIWG